MVAVLNIFPSLYYILWLFLYKVWDVVQRDIQNMQDPQREHHALETNGKDCYMVIVGKKTMTKELFDRIQSIVDRREMEYASEHRLVTKIVTFHPGELRLINKMEVGEQVTMQQNCRRAIDESDTQIRIEIKVGYSKTQILC